MVMFLFKARPLRNVGPAIMPTPGPSQQITKEQLTLTLNYKYHRWDENLANPVAPKPHFPTRPVIPSRTLNANMQGNLKEPPS
jgi:hypothetical protein